MKTAYVVTYKEDGTLTRPIAFSTKEKALAFIESLKDQYIVNLREHFGRPVPDSFRDHLELEVVELQVE